jgi:phosphate starvation-inducible PhoH-like protein
MNIKKKVVSEINEVNTESYFNLQKIPINLKCKNAAQKKLVKLITDNVITICAGRAGTGKTFVACAQALKMLKTEKYKKILLVKSVTVLEDEDVGYLKGDLNSKMLPFTISFLDNFHKIIGEENTQRMIQKGLIEVMPLAYIRGRSIDDSIIIVDEAQNISIKNMRSTLTRIGDNSKMIIIGDSKQIDMKNKKLSSLDIVVEMFNEKNDIGTMRFTTDDIVRSPMVMMIENEFDSYEENNKVK